MVKLNQHNHNSSYFGAAALLALSVLQPSVQAATPAFYGAQGGGAASVGGRGGKVIEVTNLNDSGSGSLRACVDASGPRICVFRVGGTISFSSQLKISNPYITIAGQTAPGGGITLKGNNVLSTDPFRPATHNIIVRYIRIGVGYNSGRTAQTGDAVSVYGGTNNAIFDHVSLRWGQDETFQMWNNGGGINNITLSNAVLADPVSGHSTFLISGGGSSTLSAQVNNNDWHHNLIVTGSHRIPLDKAGSSAFINNIVYNYGFYCSQILGGGKHDYIGNVYKQGPYTRSNGATGKHEIQANSSSGADSPDGSPVIYVSGNIGWNNTSPTGGQAPMMARVSGENGSETGAVPSTWLASSRQVNQTHQIVPDRADTLASTLLPHVGASRRLACDGSWVSNRDSLDAGWVSNFQNGTGSNPSQSSAFVTVSNGTACADSDHDGMPDVWESANGLNPNSADNNGDVDGDGFTNVEEYLNGTNPRSANNSTGGSTTTPNPTPSDTTPPSITAGAPSGTLSAGTTATTMSVATNEAATCRYATSAGVAFAQMPGAFASTGGASHATTISGLQNSGTYMYFVRCRDAAGNASPSDYSVAFSVANTTTAPAGGVSSYEAESTSNTLYGGAKVGSVSTCSGGKAVGYIGNTGWLQFNSVAAATAGQYQLTIYYMNPNPASMQVSVNGNTATAVQLPATGAWTTVRSITVPVTLNATSSNAIRLSNPSGWTSDVDRIVIGGTAPAPTPGTVTPKSYEAESTSNTLIGAAKTGICGTCSGGGVVGYIGVSGSLRFNGVSVPAAGQYKVTIYYATRDTANMTARISANGGAATSLTIPGSGGWTIIKSVTVPVQLNAGNNTILYANPVTWAPDIDRIVVSQ